jgi:hypothetical protein
MPIEVNNNTGGWDLSSVTPPPRRDADPEALVLDGYPQSAPTIQLPEPPQPAITEEPIFNIDNSVPASQRYDEVFEYYGNKYGVDSNLLWALAKTESGFSDDVITGNRLSSAGAVGLMQFMPSTAEGYNLDPTDPVDSIRAAAQYMSRAMQEHGSIDAALSVYNSGRPTPRAQETFNHIAATNRYYQDRLQQTGQQAVSRAYNRTVAQGVTAAQAASALDLERSGSTQSADQFVINDDLRQFIRNPPPNIPDMVNNAPVVSSLAARPAYYPLIANDPYLVQHEQEVNGESFYSGYLDVLVFTQFLPYTAAATAFKYFDDDDYQAALDSAYQSRAAQLEETGYMYSMILTEGDNPSPEAEAYIQEYIRLGQEADYEPDGFIARTSLSMARQGALAVDMLEHFGIGAGAGVVGAAPAAVVAGGVSGGLTLGVGAPLGAGAVLATGAGIGGALNVGWRAIQVETVDSYISLREKGYEPDVSYRLATAAGIIKGTIEVGALGTIGRIAKMPGMEAMTDRLVGAMFKSVTDRGWRRLLGMTIGGGIGGLVTEPVEEVAQETTDIVAELLAYQLQTRRDAADIPLDAVGNRIPGLTFGEAWDRYVAVVNETVRSAPLLGLIGAGIAVTPEAVALVSSNSLRDSVHDLSQNVIDNIVTMKENSTAAQASPTLMQSIIEGVYVQGQNLPNFMMASARALFATGNEAGVKPGAWAEVVGISAEEFTQAVQEDLDISIPTRAVLDFLSVLPGARQHLSFVPGFRTETTLQRFLDTQEQTDQTLDTEMESIRQSPKYQALVDKLSKFKNFKSGEVEAYADVVARYALTRAKENNTDPLTEPVWDIEYTASSAEEVINAQKPAKAQSIVGKIKDAITKKQEQESPEVVEVKATVPDAVDMTDNEVEELAQNLNVKFNRETELGVEYKGSYRYENGQHLINVFKKGDVSTLVHEFMHFVVQDLMNKVESGTASEQTTQLYEALRRNAGLEEGQAWTTEHHENIAGMFELYVVSGKAPSIELRKVFRILKKALISIYQELKGREVEMSKDITDTFDKVLATEAQIEANKIKTAHDPILTHLFDSMTKKEQNEYQELIDRADLSVAKIFEQKLMGGQEELFDQFAKHAQESVEEEPIYLMAEYIAELGGISMTNALTYFTPEQIGMMNGKQEGFITQEGIVPVADVVQTYEYKSATDLYAALEDIPTRDELFNQYFELERIAWQHRENLHEEVITDDLIKLQLYETALMIKEAQRLNRKANKQARMNDRSWREIMEAATRNQSFSTYKQLIIQNVEKRNHTKTITDMAALKGSMKAAARAAREAYRAGKIEEAATQKQRQLEATIRLKHRQEIRNEKRRLIKKVDAAIRRDPRKGVVYEYHQQILALVNRHDENIRKKKQARFHPANPIGMPSLAQFAQAVNDPAKGVEIRGTDEIYFGEIDIAPWLLDPNNTLQVKDMSYDQFREYATAIIMLDELGTRAKRYMSALKKTTLEEVVDTVFDGIQTNSLGRGDLHEKASLLGRIANRIDSYTATHVSVETICLILDGGKEFGPAWNYIFRPANEAENRQKVLGAEFSDMYDKVLGKYIEAVGGQWNFARTRNELLVLKNFPEMEVTREQGIMVMLNSGTEKGIARLMNGQGKGTWTLEQIQDIRNAMTEDDIEFVQGIWSILEKMYGYANQTYRKLNGVDLHKERGIPVQTAFGVIEGKYFPIIPDPKKSQNVAIKEERDAQKNLMAMNPHHYETIYANFNKERQERSDAITYLSMATIGRHLIDAVHYTSYAVAVRDIQQLTKNRKISKAIIDSVGMNLYKEIPKWVAQIARPYSNRRTELDSLMEQIRVGTVIFQLGGNVSVMALQATSFTLTIAELSAGKSFTKATAAAAWSAAVDRFIKDEDTITAFIDERTPQLKHRGTTFERGLNEMKQSDVFSRWDQRFRHRTVNALFYGIKYIDKVTTYSTWYAAYNLGLEKFKGNEGQAIEFADMVVRKTQPTANVKDLPSVMVSPGFGRWMTTFYTFYNRVANRSVENYLLVRGKKISVKDFMKKYFWIMVVGPIMSTAIRAGMGEMADLIFGEDDRDEEYWQDLLSNFILMNFSGWVGLRDLTYYINGGVRYGQWRDFQITPVTRGVAMIGQGGAALVDMIAEGPDATNVSNAVAGGGVLFSLPLKPMRDLIKRVGD